MAVCLYDFPLNYSLSLSLPQDPKIDPQKAVDYVKDFPHLTTMGFKVCISFSSEAYTLYLRVND